MTIIEQIKAEIERHLNSATEHQNANPDMPKYRWYLYEGEKELCTDLLGYIDDSLESEKPMEGLDEEIDRLWESFADEMEGPHNLFDIYARLARHFAKWGADHTPLPEDTVIYQKGVAEGKRLMMEERETEKDEPKPKFAVGDVVCRKGWADHTIKELFIGEEPVYICTNDEGIESHIPFSEQNKWELIQKEHKPNYCHHEVYETGWTEEYRKGFYHGWNDCNMQHAQLKKEQMINNQETIKLAEDHAFLAGADWQKEQMMKEAVECELVCIKDRLAAILPMKEFQWTVGDKVRVIICKKED